MTKVTKDMIAVRRKSGKIVLRRPRIDDINPKERSAARAQSISNFAKARITVAETQAGKGKFVTFKGKQFPAHIVAGSNLIRKMSPITAEYRNRREDYQKSLRRELEQSGTAIIMGEGEVIGVARTSPFLIDSEDH